MARERQARREPEPDDERRPEQHAPVGQPREHEQRGHEGVAERHRDEGRAEARPVGDRGQVAVEEPAERELERVLRAEDEGENAHVDRGDRARAADEQRPSLDRRRQRTA
jgi:hypothetical protein